MPSSLARLAGGVLLPVLLVSACSGGRPAVEDVQSGLTASGSVFPVAEQQAECAAKMLVDSDLSDDDLRAIAEPGGDVELSSGAASTLAGLQVEVLSACTS